jgi:hypothetical protein
MKLVLTVSLLAVVGLSLGGCFGSASRSRAPRQFTPTTGSAPQLRETPECRGVPANVRTSDPRCNEYLYQAGG